MPKKTSFTALIVPSSVDNDILSYRSVCGHASQYRKDMTRACKRIGLTPETVDRAGIKVRITIEKLED